MLGRDEAGADGEAHESGDVVDLKAVHELGHAYATKIYGGEVHDQRYIVSAPSRLGDRQGWYTLLRYNLTGRDNRLNRERRVWHDYKFYLWWSAGADNRYGTSDDVLTAPPVNTNTVQTMCAGCHLTGWERYQDRATAVSYTHLTLPTILRV